MTRDAALINVNPQHVVAGLPGTPVWFYLTAVDDTPVEMPTPSGAYRCVIINGTDKVLKVVHNLESAPAAIALADAGFAAGSGGTATGAPCAPVPPSVNLPYDYEVFEDDELVTTTWVATDGTPTGGYVIAMFLVPAS